MVHVPNTELGTYWVPTLCMPLPKRHDSTTVRPGIDDAALLAIKLPGEADIASPPTAAQTDQYEFDDGGIDDQALLELGV
jgi:hypothetical protein